jgi:predicted lipoprotein with Yx(FWY)xxD motif
MPDPMNSRMIAAVVAIVVVIAVAGAAVAVLGGSKTTTTTSSTSSIVTTSTTPVVTTTSTTSSATSTTSTSSVTSSAALSIEIQNSSSLGSYLTNGTGWTLYLFTKDTPNTGNSSCYGTCQTFWPPLYGNSSTLVLPAGLNASAFGTIKRTDGTSQITYEGWPLYYYSGDHAAGQTNGQNKSGTWFVVNYPTINISTSSTTTSSVTSSSSSTSSVATTTTSSTPATTTSTTEITTKTTS